MKSFMKYLILSLLAFCPALSQAQCAMCRAVLQNEDQGGAAAAINDGITFLVIWPYLLIGFVFFMIWRMMVKMKKH